MIHRGRAGRRLGEDHPTWHSTVKGLPAMAGAVLVE